MVPHFIIIHLSKWKNLLVHKVHLLLIFILIFSLCFQTRVYLFREAFNAGAWQFQSYF